MFEYDKNKPFWLNHAIATITTDDLDPVYVGLFKSRGELGESIVHRFLAAMSVFYHIGFCCEIAAKTTDENFWDYLLANFEGTKRGTERRYFRGEQGLNCLKYLKNNFKTPTDFVLGLYRRKYSGLMDSFKEVPAFGPYFIWKMQDFYDRILGMEVEPDTCIKHLPAEPIKGMKLVQSEMGLESYTTAQMFEYMESNLNHIAAPPNPSRMIDIREIETCMCMLKHYYNGSDYVGKDLKDKQDCLVGYGEVADVILKNMPVAIPRSYFTVPNEILLKLNIKQELQKTNILNFFS